MNILLQSFISVKTMYEKISLLLNHSYSWWVKPRNVYHNGLNLFSTIGNDSGAYISSYNGVDTDSLKIRDFATKDEHNAPSFKCLDDHIFVVSHPRNSTDFVCGTASYDLETLGTTFNLNDSAGFTSANYSQLFYINGRMFLFCREAHQKWAVTWSDDYLNKDSYTTRKILFEKTDAPEKDFLYMHGLQEGDKIVFGIYYHPDSDENNKFHLAEFDTATGELSEAGTSLGNVYDSGFTTVNTASLQSLYQPDAGKQIRFLDISFSDNASTINILFSHFLNDESDGDYILKKYNRTDLTSVEYPIINHGYDTYMTYFGGAYFVKNSEGVWNNTVYLARNESDIWYVEEWKFNGNSFYKAKEIDSLPSGSAGLSLTRPEPPIDSQSGGLKVIYQKGDYDETFTTWDNEIIGIK